MIPKIGCDIVRVEKFEKSAKRSGQKIKALGLKAGDWQMIEINKNAKGRPQVKLMEVDRKIIHRDLSISHDGKYAMAVAVFLIGN